MLQYDNFMINILHFGQDQRKCIPTLKKLFIMIFECRDDEQGLAITKTSYEYMYKKLKYEQFPRILPRNTLNGIGNSI